MSFLWTIRAVNLLVVLPRKLPFCLQYFRYPHVVTVILAYFSSKGTTPSRNSTPEFLASAISFDRRIAAISLFMDASANALIAISPTASQPLFIFLTALNALTSGGHPAIQSLGAVSLRAMGRANEMGLVFGALGLSNAVSHIIAVRTRVMLPLFDRLSNYWAFVRAQPGSYATLYGATVATFPKAMFVMSAVLLYVAVSLLAWIQPNIHIWSGEPENTAISPQSERVDEAEVVPRTQNRSPHDGLEHDILQRLSVISLSTPDD